MHFRNNRPSEHRTEYKSRRRRQRSFIELTPSCLVNVPQQCHRIPGWGDGCRRIIIVGNDDGAVLDVGNGRQINDVGQCRQERVVTVDKDQAALDARI